jgi:hypothetical protein
MRKRSPLRAALLFWVGEEGLMGGEKPSVWSATFLFFMGLVEACFCRGFWRKAGAACGVFVVKLWWNAW